MLDDTERVAYAQCVPGLTGLCGASYPSHRCVVLTRPGSSAVSPLLKPSARRAPKHKALPAARRHAWTVGLRAAYDPCVYLAVGSVQSDRFSRVSAAGPLRAASCSASRRVVLVDRHGIPVAVAVLLRVHSQGVARVNRERLLDGLPIDVVAGATVSVHPSGARVAQLHHHEAGLTCLDDRPRKVFQRLRLERRGVELHGLGACAGSLHERVIADSEPLDIGRRGTGEEPRGAGHLIAVLVVLSVDGESLDGRGLLI